LEKIVVACFDQKTLEVYQKTESASSGVWGQVRPAQIRITINQMRKKPFSIISKGELTSPIIAHVPYGSTFIPQDVRYSLLHRYFCKKRFSRTFCKN
jgi:hypothetical protein